MQNILTDYGRLVARAVERAHGIKTSHNLCLSCGHSIDAHDRQYGCAEDGCDCETPNARLSGPQQREEEPEPPPADLRCCANCAHWHKKEYIHCQCSGPWGGNIFGDKNCTFRAQERE